MNWFKHDTNASQDAKIKKLLIRYGVTGYAIYFHCLELIASDISETNITFCLEHDSEIIADNLKIKGTSDKSGIDVVEDIMTYLVDVGLFDQMNDTIFCFKLLKRLDTSMTSSTKMRTMIKGAKENHDTVMINHDGVMQEEKRREEKRREEITDTKKVKPKLTKYGDRVKLKESDYNELCTIHTKQVVDSKIVDMNDYLLTHGKTYKNYNAALRGWIKKDKDKQQTQQPQNPVHQMDCLDDSDIKAGLRDE